MHWQTPSRLLRSHPSPCEGEGFGDELHSPGRDEGRPYGWRGDSVAVGAAVGVGLHAAKTIMVER
ncbi:MAG: hypothetical protein OEZ02_02465 [Anaerolineae bacterium]|nr:hypothetical protein [Anaerolineae bacterium]